MFISQPPVKRLSLLVTPTDLEEVLYRKDGIRLKDLDRVKDTILEYEGEWITKIIGSVVIRAQSARTKHRPFEQERSPHTHRRTSRRHDSLSLYVIRRVDIALERDEETRR